MVGAIFAVEGNMGFTNFLPHCIAAGFPRLGDLMGGDNSAEFIV
jgi:hypothetical protein